MAKKEPAPLTEICAEDIAKVVAAEDDFGFELRVGAMIRGTVQNAKVTHGGTYRDPATQVARQYDYRIRRGRDDIELSMAVECKNISLFSPLVINTAKRRSEEGFQDLVTTQDRTAINQIRRFHNNSLYPTGAPVGKSSMLVQAGEPPKAAKDEEIYKRWAQAIASAYDLFVLAATDNSPLVNRESISAILPILVVPNEALWEVHYDENGTIIGTPERVQESQYFVDRFYHYKKLTFSFSHLHIFTVEGLQTFLRRLENRDDVLWENIFNV